MNALLLTGRGEPSVTFIAEVAERTHQWRACRDLVTLAEVADWEPDVILSYNYRHLVPPVVLAVPRLGAWNLHPSMLPVGRGAHPVFWALAEGEPAGVTVHEMNAGLDTGPILTQLMWPNMWPAGGTLRQAYDFIHLMMRETFWRICWPLIESGSARDRLRQQGGVSTYHRAEHLERYWPKLPDGWDTPIEVVRGLGLEHATAHG